MSIADGILSEAEYTKITAQEKRQLFNVLLNMNITTIVNEPEPQVRCRGARDDWAE